ncbi:MAG: hypothetical protein AB8G14_17190 [Ilumatobacter sp.]
MEPDPMDHPEPPPHHVPPNFASVSPEVRDGLRRIHVEITPDAAADRAMLDLWFTILTAPPSAALGAYTCLTNEYLPWLERRLVRRARTRGSSWTGIGRVLRRSRQAVQQRHDRTFSISELAAPRPPGRTPSPPVG